MQMGSRKYGCPYFEMEGLNMYLVIAEKPSVSQAIAKVIGAYKRKAGYLEGRDCLVSWCLGHLAEYCLLYTSCLFRYQRPWKTA